MIDPLELVVSICLVLSGIFGLVGSYGMVRLRDVMQQLHAPTKATTLGVGGALLASMIHFGLQEGQFTFHELLITLFLFLTAPVSAQFIAKVHMVGKLRRGDLPRPGAEGEWAIFAPPPESRPRDGEGKG